MDTVLQRTCKSTTLHGVKITIKHHKARVPVECVHNTKPQKQKAATIRRRENNTETRKKTQRATDTQPDAGVGAGARNTARYATPTIYSNVRLNVRRMLG